MFDRVWRAANIAHGTVTAQTGWTGVPKEAPPGMLIAGTKAPRLTNVEAVKLIRAYRAAVVGTSTMFQLWAQYAAIAYGWDPPSTDALDASPLQADASYVPDVCVALWMELHRITLDLDRSGSIATLELDGGFADAEWLADLRSVLRADGADAQFKIPMPFCRDKRTGRSRVPRPPCDTRDPLTGKPWGKCDEPGDCEAVMVDDPVTALVKSLWPLALVVGALWLLSQPSEQPRRIRRYRDN